MLVKDISYKKLQLAVLEGKVDLSGLNIFREAYNNIPAFGIKIHAGIIGTSHFVQIQKADGTIFTEIFACDVLEKKEIKPLCFLPIQKITSPIRIESDCTYQFSCQNHSYQKTAKNISIWSKKEKDNQPFIFLEYHFNVAEDCPTSRTILSIKKTTDGIQINTVHEYQEEDAIILSESLILF